MIRRSALERALLRTLQGWQRGELRMELPGGEVHRFGSPRAGENAVVQVHRRRFLRRVALGGDVAVGESYVDGDWSTPDLPGLICAYIRNQRHVQLRGLRGAPLALWSRLRHWARRNTRDGSQRNIHAHYDLGNDFYRLFLDDSMTYSAGLFDDPGLTLETAQERKFARICRQLRIAPDDHVLEIGCGWGGFAIHAARTVGCRVTGITISREQLAHARERVRALGLQDRVEIRYCDYRDIEGEYDKIVSIEMLEAVGEAFWPAFVRQLETRLRPDGLAFLQVICVHDAHFARYRRQVGWVQQYIFPGGMLPSLYELQRTLKRYTKLELHDVREIGLDYVRTLREWRERFWKNVDAVRQLGFDERFLRMWDYYLSVTQAGFATYENRDLQLVLSRRNNALLSES